MKELDPINNTPQLEETATAEKPQRCEFLKRAWDALDRPIDALHTKLQKSPFWQEYGYLALCFLLPALIVYLIYLSRMVHPFGDGCVLVLDLNGQYVYYFEYFFFL